MFFGFFLYILGGLIYQENFGIRFSSEDFYVYKIEDFENLVEEEKKFVSDKGQLLCGRLYSNSSYPEKKGLVVFAHGYGGGGHNGYLPFINFFAKNGYYVFAYDATGTDGSEGTSIYGLPQQIVDMDYAITYAESIPMLEGLPVFIFGHSWGGYTVTNELAFHPEVKAAVCIAGFDYSMDLIESWGCKIAGAFFTKSLIPYLSIHEYLMCGSISKARASNALSKTQSKVMFITADNDNIVGTEYGFDLWQKKFSDNPNFSFIKIYGLEANESHNNVLSSDEYLQWRKEINEIGFDDKKEFWDQLEYRHQKAYQVNEVLFNQMLDFFGK